VQLELGGLNVEVEPAKDALDPLERESGCWSSSYWLTRSIPGRSFPALRRGEVEPEKDRVVAEADEGLHLVSVEEQLHPGRLGPRVEQAPAVRFGDERDGRGSSPRSVSASGSKSM